MWYLGAGKSNNSILVVVALEMVVYGEGGKRGPGLLLWGVGERSQSSPSLWAKVGEGQEYGVVVVVVVVQAEWGILR